MTVNERKSLEIQKAILETRLDKIKAEIKGINNKLKAKKTVGLLEFIMKTDLSIKEVAKIWDVHPSSVQKIAQSAGIKLKSDREKKTSQVDLDDQLKKGLDKLHARQKYTRITILPGGEEVREERQGLSKRGNAYKDKHNYKSA